MRAVGGGGALSGPQASIERLAVPAGESETIFSAEDWMTIPGFAFRCRPDEEAADEDEEVSEEEKPAEDEEVSDEEEADERRMVARGRGQRGNG